MLTVALALGAACGWGVADFLAGGASRRSAVLPVLCLTQALGLVLALLAAGIVGPGSAGPRYLLFALASGLALAVGLGALYRGMTVGAMGILSPIAATGTAIPVLVGLLQGDRPSAIQAVGVVMAGGGVVLASWPISDGRRATPARADLRDGWRDRPPRFTAGIGFGLLAAAGGGLTAVALKEAAPGGVLWVLIVQRATVATLAGLASARVRTSVRVPRALWPALAAAGTADVAATGLFATASRHGELAVVAVIGALYPVVTVGLALTVLHERLTRPQLAGVVTALIGTGAIAAGAT